MDIYDVRVIANQVYLIMELVQGPSVLDRLKDGPLPPREVLLIGEHVALALQAAAEAGIVHRDIKPSNILLDPKGTAKLTDFGIARSFYSEEGTPLSPGGADLSYSSPENAKEVHRANVRSDIYGLGATLYHMLCGRPPFQPQTKNDLFETIGMEVRRLESYDLDPKPPRVLCALVHAMLAKNPDDRPYPPSLLARSLHNVRVDLADTAQQPVYETGSRAPVEPPPEA